jgi:peptide/nickel transport system permease protein
MGKFILRRLLALIPVWIGIITLTFLMRVVVPGDPVELMLFGQPKTPEVVANIRAEMGLDKPLPEQYFNYIFNAVRGDFGKSLSTRRPVVNEIGDRFVKTIILAVSSLIIGLVFGLIFGTLSAIFKDTFLDTLVTFFALLGLSLPPIWLGLLMINFFGVQLKWLPVVGRGDIIHLIMPAVTLGIIQAAVLARFVRSSLLEVLNQDYIRTASAKGLNRLQMLNRHALKNALIPVLTILGLQFGVLLGGAIIVENIFAWPGLGQLAVKAIGQRDFPVIQGIVLVSATAYVVINLVIDILYGVVDPRIAKT